MYVLAGDVDHDGDNSGSVALYGEGDGMGFQGVAKYMPVKWGCGTT